jgi:hypothetical protein
MAKPTLPVVIGYLDSARKSDGYTHIITLAGRKISVADSVISSKHQIEPGENGSYRFFLTEGAIISAEMLATDLFDGETHWSSDTASRPRLGLRSSNTPLDAETHFSHDTA